MLGISTAILALISAAIIAVLMRGRANLLQRLDRLGKQYEEAKLEQARLEEALSYRNSEEDERFSRLEHDLRSSISVIVGFSALLREFVDMNPEQPFLLVKGSSAIQQAAEKSLRILDAAVADEPKTLRHEGLAVEGRH